MNAGKAVLAQIMEFASRYEFNKCVDKYNGNHKVKTFTCWEQFIVMSFAQLTYRESLRDIEACLQAISNKLYHCGVKSKVAKSTLADANESRDWRIYADFAQQLINEARGLYKDDNDFKIEIDEIAYALDSSTIDLCLSLFPWAKFRKKKGAVKMHTLLDLRGSIPTFIEITDGKVHDVNILDLLLIEPGAVYIMDRAYVDFSRLFDMHQAQAYFVIREKQHLRIKKFYGTSFNAVCTQIWIAVSVYLLVAIIKKRLKLEQELYTILQIFSISLFEKVPLDQLFSESDYRNTDNDNYNQLKLFDL